MSAFLDNLRLALGTFLGNPLRTLLTLLGIVIGVATVVSMMGLIEGLRLKVNQDLSVLGANTFEVSKWPSGFGNFNWRKYAKRPNLTEADAESLLGHAPSVSQVAASVNEGGQKLATALAETRPNVQVWGATPAYEQTSGLTVASGRFFGEVDEVEGREVVVLGGDVVDALFPGQEPLGQEVRIRGRPYRVVGVLQRRGSFLGMVSMDNLALMPLRTFLAAYGSQRSLDLNVQAGDAKNLERAQTEVRTLVRARHGLKPQEEDDFEVTTNESMTRTFNQLSGLITAASFGICLLSLLVGGIGILNIMLVSVTERTKEIGVRKALGARRSRILAQFATEAVALSLLGGALGVALGFGVAFLARWMLGFPTVVPLWAVALSLAMSSGTGLVFGIYPASRAARLDPVEAMRAD
jgi:putative ABC transport system permease protein